MTTKEAFEAIQKIVGDVGTRTTIKVIERNYVHSTLDGQVKEVVEYAATIGYETQTISSKGNVSSKFDSLSFLSEQSLEHLVQLIKVSLESK